MVRWAVVITEGSGGRFIPTYTFLAGLGWGKF